MRNNWMRLLAAVLAFGLAAPVSADDQNNRGNDNQNANRQQDNNRNNDREDEKEFSDENFVKKVASCNLLESKLGEIAQLKATRPNVRFFGKQMVMDHAAAMNALREAARDANIQVPNELADKHKEIHEKFRDYKDEQFDRDYMKQVLDNHEKSLELYTTAIKEAKNERVRAYAERFRPVIEKHRDQAKKMYEELGGNRDNDRD
jgi:putative membrane protein